MKIALALGGGGAKGISHLGVVSGLYQMGFEIVAIAGTSIGGLIGALIACGYSPEELRARFERLDQRKLFGHRDGDLPSLLGLAGMTGELADLLGNRTFADLKIRFAATVVDIRACEERILDSGSLIDAVLATIAIPGIFPPRELPDGALLVDGGMTNPVPVNIARHLAPRTPVFAVPLTLKPTEPIRREHSGLLAPFRGSEYLSRLRMGQAVHTFLGSWDASSRLLTRMRLDIDSPDIIIKPAVEDIQLLGRIDVNDVFSRGEQAVLGMQDELLSAVSLPRRVLRLMGLTPRRFNSRA